MNPVAYLTGYLTKEAIAPELLDAAKTVGIGAGAGALAGGAYGATKSKLQEDEVDKRETAMDALKGAGIGAAAGGLKAGWDNRAKLLEMLKGIIGKGQDTQGMSPV